MADNVAKMNVTEEELGLLTKKLSISVDKEIVCSKEEEVYKDIKINLQVPGFRKGKVPIVVLKQRFAKHVEGEVLKTLVPDYCDKALEEKEFVPVETPKIEDVDYKEGSSLTFTATCEIYPEVEPKGYEGLDLDIAEEEVTDEKVEEIIGNLRKSMAELVDKEEGSASAAKDDVVTIDIVTTVDGKEVKDLLQVYENFKIEIGTHKFIPEFEDALVGKNIDDVVEHTITMPEDFHNKDYAGKEACVKATIKEVKQKNIPDEDGAIAKKFLGEEATLEELKKSIVEELKVKYADEKRNSMKQKLKEALVKDNEFDIPPSIMKKEVEGQMFNEHMALIREGESWKLAMRNPIEPGEETKKNAADASTYFILINMIIELEGIAPSEDELRTALATYGLKKGVGFENGLPKISESEMYQVQFALLEDAVISFVTKSNEPAEADNNDKDNIDKDNNE